MRDTESDLLFDPIFPTQWSDRLNEFFVDVTLERLAGVGHYTPLEAPARFASAIQGRLAAPTKAAG